MLRLAEYKSYIPAGVFEKANSEAEEAKGSDDEAHAVPESLPDHPPRCGEQGRVFFCFLLSLASFQVARNFDFCLFTGPNFSSIF